MGVSKNKRKELVPGIQVYPSGTIASANLVSADGNGNLVDSGVPASDLSPLTLGSGAGIGMLQVAHAIYSFVVDGGAVGAITPASNSTIPANAILVAATINPTTAVTSAGSATAEVGTAAGSSATSILGSTAKASLTIDALINGACTFAAPVKMSAAGQIQITVGTAALTAGVIEIFVFYVLAKNS
jgi:hypothetical protein